MAQSPRFEQESAPRPRTRPMMAAAMAALLVGLAACSESDSAGVQAESETAAPASAAETASAGAETGAVSAAAAAAAQEASSQAVTTGDVDEALADKGYALGDIVLGSPDAPVTMIEYASLTCPACQAFHERTVPTLKQEYIDTGKLKLIVRELHGARIGLDATAIARCDGADKYHPFLNLLFSRQENYLTQSRSANLEELRRIGKVGGLSTERIEQCLTDEAYLNEIYQFSREHVERDQVPATPFLILQPGPDQQTIRGAVGAEELSEMIDGLLGG